MELSRLKTHISRILLLLSALSFILFVRQQFNKTKMEVFQGEMLGFSCEVQYRGDRLAISIQDELGKQNDFFISGRACVMFDSLQSKIGELAVVKVPNGSNLIAHLDVGKRIYVNESTTWVSGFVGGGVLVLTPFIIAMVILRSAKKVKKVKGDVFI